MTISLDQLVWLADGVDIPALGVRDSACDSMDCPSCGYAIFQSDISRSAERGCLFYETPRLPCPQCGTLCWIEVDGDIGGCDVYWDEDAPVEAIGQLICNGTGDPCQCPDGDPKPKLVSCRWDCPRADPPACTRSLVRTRGDSTLRESMDSRQLAGDTGDH